MKWAWLATALSLLATPALGQDLTLTGVLTGADHQTYREVPFRVPAGVSAVTVEFAYTGKEQRSVIDLGLRDPQRFRGWSGGNKARFTVSETWATPSYLPGPLPAGTWKLILGVPNLRKDGRAEYTAKVTFERGFHGFTAAPLKAASGWYRGDLHLHTAHSDGSCASRTGQRVPCPLDKTLEAAAARGLDFVAVTEHNSPSHHQALAEAQPYFDDLLLIPGREVTTFHGHANVFGVTAPLDFQRGFGRVLDQASAAAGLTSINHPGLPSGEACMGCGWTWSGDIGRVGAVEVINGAVAEGPLSGFAFWERQLNAGRRVTAIGGSDNHDPARAPGVGVPTTVVYAESLSHDAILAGLREGRVFIDVQGTGDRVLDVTAGEPAVPMGGELHAAAGATRAVTAHVKGGAGGKVVLVTPRGRTEIAPDLPLQAEERRAFHVAADVPWLRVEVRGPDGKLWLVGNPIYVRP